MLQECPIHNARCAGWQQHISGRLLKVETCSKCSTLFLDWPPTGVVLTFDNRIMLSGLKTSTWTILVAIKAIFLLFLFIKPSASDVSLSKEQNVEPLTGSTIKSLEPSWQLDPILAKFTGLVVRTHAQQQSPSSLHHFHNILFFGWQINFAASTENVFCVRGANQRGLVLNFVFCKNPWKTSFNFSCLNGLWSREWGKIGFRAAIWIFRFMLIYELKFIWMETLRSARRRIRVNKTDEQADISGQKS